MKAPAIRILRNRKKGTGDFREAAHAVAKVVTGEMKKLIRSRKVDPDSISILLILRSGMAFLGSVTAAFPDAPIGFAGIKRDDQTALPRWYYQNFPPLGESRTVIIFDAMLATGGSTEQAILYLKRDGVKPANIFFGGMIAAQEGVKRLSNHLPKENILIAAIDEQLDERKLVSPGIGEFSNRYFGYLG